MSDPSAPPSPSTTSASGLTPRPGDADHDAWLHAALRHAPDADASPPESLRRSILDEARAAAFARARASPGDALAKPIATMRRPNIVIGALAAFWTWLARPAVAAGFASVMAATLVGVMWWDRPLDETLPSATPPVDAVRQAPAAADRSAANQFTPSATEPAARPRSAPSLQPVPSKPTAVEDKRIRAEVERAPAPKRQADTTTRSTAEPAAARDATAVADTPLAAAAPQPFAAPAPAPMAPPTSLAKAAPMARAAVPEPRSRMALGASVSSPSVSSASVAGPLGEVLASVGAEPARWSVRKASGARAVVDDALRDWLARVDASVEWRSSRALDNAALEAAKTSETTTAESTTTLTLLRDGQVDTVVRIGGDRVVVERHGRAAGATTTAALPAQTAADLAVSLPASAR